MTITTLTPSQTRQAIAEGAHLVDIRDHDEHVREMIPGAKSIPLARIHTLPASDHPVVFHCRSGTRTTSNAGLLQAAADGAPCYILEGGIDAWRAAGFPVRIDRRQPLELMRQVQLVAGGLILLGVLLGFMVMPVFFGLSAFVGAGLMLAGATGWCGMANLLRFMPWNRAVFR